MSPKRLRISEEEEERYYSDPLHTILPDELLRLILSKITDPETLLRSSLVSKRIASILSRSESLTLQFPTPLSFPSVFPGKSHPSSDWTKSVGNLFLRLTNLLRIFNRVRSLRIELPCHCRCPDDTVFKWKAKTGIRCGLLSFLSAKSVSKIDDSKIDDKERRSATACADHAYFNASIAGGPYFYASAMHRLMQLLIPWHPNLDCVELVDSKKHGKLSIGGEALIKLRKTTPESMSNFITQPPGLEKVWYRPKLRLPVSGFEMEEVAFVLSRGYRVASGGVGEEVEGSSDDDALDGGFEDDEHGIFGEAMTQILTKHPLETTYF